MNLILGRDGRKMSSSWGNTINIFDEADDMFGKVMSIPDELIISYFEHCTRIPPKQIREYIKQLEVDTVNPRDIKVKLAKEITTIYWGKANAQKAKENFNSIFQKKEIPDKILEQKLSNKNIIDVLFKSGLARSKGEARRLIKQKGIKINEKIIDSIDKIVKNGDIIQKGKRYFLKII